SVINSLANQKMSYAEIVGANTAIFLALFIIERKWLVKNVSTKEIQYELIENIKPENHELLKADLENRTGLTINSIVVGDVDFLKDSASIHITYFTNQ
ncbi:MAG: hypothetical protein ACI8ZN_000522, partial [Bacteroidia bacterium]